METNELLIIILCVLCGLVGGTVGIAAELGKLRGDISKLLKKK